MHRLISAWGISIVAAVLVAAVGWPVVSGDVVAGDKDESPKHLTGKFVSILRKSGPDSPTNLEKVHVMKLEERSFLVGTGADTPDNWQKGRTVGVAIDDIGEITVFDSLEDLRKALSDSEPKVAPPAKT